MRNFTVFLLTVAVLPSYVGSVHAGPPRQCVEFQDAVAALDLRDVDSAQKAAYELRTLGLRCDAAEKAAEDKFFRLYEIYLNRYEEPMVFHKQVLEEGSSRAVEFSTRKLEEIEKDLAAFIRENSAIIMAVTRLGSVDNSIWQNVDVGFSAHFDIGSTLRKFVELYIKYDKVFNVIALMRLIDDRNLPNHASFDAGAGYPDKIKLINIYMNHKFYDLAMNVILKFLYEHSSHVFKKNALDQVQPFIKRLEHEASITAEQRASLERLLETAYKEREPEAMREKRPLTEEGAEGDTEVSGADASMPAAKKREKHVSFAEKIDAEAAATYLAKFASGHGHA